MIGVKQWLACLGTVGTLAVVQPSQAADPLEEIDGTEDWDQVARHSNAPPGKKPGGAPDIIKREILEWEKVRQLWQDRREDFAMEKVTQQKLQQELALRGKPAPIGEEVSADSGGSDFDVSGVDHLIDTELGESKALPAKSGTGASTARPAVPARGAEGKAVNAFRQPSAEDRKLAEEQEVARLRQIREAEEQRRLDEEAQRRKLKEDEARKRAEEERAGAAAAAALLKQQEEAQRREQELLRQKAKLEEDEEGQMVDPELRREMEGKDEEEEEEED